jgi:Winged helix domain, variant/ATPase family associated with various cellular activities (AAA)
MSDWAAANEAFLHDQLEALRERLARLVHDARARRSGDPLREHRALVVSEAEADVLLAPRADPSPQVPLRGAEPTTGSPALEVLAAQFSLTPFERGVLVLCLAPELDPSFERLYGYLQDDLTRKRATPQLALAVLGGGLRVREAFMPDALLRRYALLRPSDTPNGGELRVDERIRDYVLGVDRLDEQVDPLLAPLVPAPLSPAHLDLARRLERLAGERGAPALNLYGAEGSGKRALAAALCARLGLEPRRLVVSRLPPPGPEQRELLRILERDALLSGLGLYVEPGEDDQTADALSRLEVFVVLGSEERLRLGPDVVTVPVPRPGALERRSLWTQALGERAASLNGQIEAIAEQFEAGPSDVVRAIEAAVQLARLRGSDAPPTGDDLWEACREQTVWTLDELAQRIEPVYTWSDVVVPTDVLAQLHELADQVAHRAHVYGAWGFGEKLGRGRGISALFAGPSGTGKTMAAEILAGHLRLDLYRIDLAGVVSKYVGETEKNLRRVFDAAERSGAILFFDEADALFGKRSEVRDSHDRYANVEIGYLLQRMEDYRGLAILATNMKELLDQAFLRRLRFLVDFPFPGPAERRDIWSRVFPPQAEVEELDLDFLARLEITGGNIRTIAVNSAFLAAAEGSPIRLEHVLHAARREYAKIAKLVSPAEFGPHYAAVAR